MDDSRPCAYVFGALCAGENNHRGDGVEAMVCRLGDGSGRLEMEDAGIVRGDSEGHRSVAQNDHVYWG